MSIIVYNTKTGRKSLLTTYEQDHVKLYVCGITAYDYCHIGHARSALVFDMIVRYLRYRGYKVTYIRNFTDIDDKIIKRAQERNTSSQELAEEFIRKFHEDMERLGVQSPTLEPKATEHIPEIIAMIEELIGKDLAYQIDGDVYYRVDRFANYGSLSGRTLDDMQAGARISVNENKENPMDFALWKSSKPGEPTWDSPWGPGRPGWHIECSAMSRKFLGDSFDIHGGGKDLIFPHHENEIAQSEGATGSPFVATWIHHGFVTIKDEKMSKSLGNFLTIREVLEKYDPEALRLFVFSTHYRNPLDYSDEAMKDAESGLDRFYTCLAEIDQLADLEGKGNKSVTTEKEAQKLASLVDRFRKAMDNDFNSAQALGHLFDAVKTLNRIRLALPGKPATTDLNLLRNGAETLKNLAAILGLLNEEPATYVRKRQEKIIKDRQLDPQKIESLIQERSSARQHKDWTKADAIRDELSAMNIEIKDDAAGTTWKVKLN